MADEPDDVRPPAWRIQAEFPDPPQLRRPEPEPPGLIRKSVIAGAVAGTVTGATVLLGCSGALGPFEGAILATLCGIAAWIGFVLFRRRLFAARPRRRPRARY